MKHPYRKVISTLDAKPRDLIVVDDMIENVLTALKMGMSGVLVGTPGKPQGVLHINDIYGISRVVT